MTKVKQVLWLMAIGGCGVGTVAGPVDDSAHGDSVAPSDAASVPPGDGDIGTPSDGDAVAPADALTDEDTSPPVVTDSALLAWDANTEADLAGYRIYYGTASGAYGSPISAGLNNTYTVSPLTPGTTFYFAVTAFDTAGNESLASNEVSKTMP